LLALFVAVTAMMLRRFTRPLEMLVSAARAVAAGNLRQTIEVQSQDEVGQLAQAFNHMVASVRKIALGLQQSIIALNDAVATLSCSASEQNQAITRQATALQQTQVTAQEIKQTSVMAAQKADSVLQVTARADEASKSGEKAIERSLSGLMEIRQQVDGIAVKVKELNGKTRQIGSITGSVKDLADQSNMLALNAAIEAVRSGEHGKGFAVVAREVRSLADQSIQATERVREILEDVADAITVTVDISVKGVEKMEGGLSQVRTSGENLQQLASIVQDNLDAVRQIAGAVSQQNAGIAQIFGAVTDQNAMMEETAMRLETTMSSIRTLCEVSENIVVLANTYEV
jgi:methyl-accepting chemotaxis protein